MLCHVTRCPLVPLGLFWSRGARTWRDQEKPGGATTGNKAFIQTHHSRPLFRPWRLSSIRKRLSSRSLAPMLWPMAISSARCRTFPASPSPSPSADHPDFGDLGGADALNGARELDRVTLSGSRNSLDRVCLSGSNDSALLDGGSAEYAARGVGCDDCERPPRSSPAEEGAAVASFPFLSLDDCLPGCFVPALFNAAPRGSCPSGTGTERCAAEAAELL